MDLRGGGGRLALCIALLLLAVFITRDEDNIQADNILAENFTLADRAAPHTDNAPLRGICGTSRRSTWDRALLVQAGHPPRRDLTPARARSGLESTPSTAAIC